MSLYTPNSFRWDDRAAVAALIDAHPFALLLTVTDGCEPAVTHLPLLRDGDCLVGHMARANPHWQQFAAGRTLAVFQGPHAYVSPRWYVEPAEQVPTWNFAAVHLSGRVEVLTPAEAGEAVRVLTRRFDPGFVPAPGRVEQLLGGIVAFRLHIERVEAKNKMNQNKTAADRAGVIAGLRATGRPEDAAVAAWMQGHD